MSLLRPGKVSDFVANLRDKAIRELDKPEEGAKDADPSFELKQPPVNLPTFDQDDNGVSRFQGVWDPWVGNGRLPWG